MSNYVNESTAYRASVLFSDQLEEVNYVANCYSSHVKDVQHGDLGRRVG